MSEVLRYEPLEAGTEKSPTKQYTDKMKGGAFGDAFRTSASLGAAEVVQQAESAQMSVEEVRNQTDSRVQSNDRLVNGGARIGYIDDGSGGERPFFEVTEKQIDKARNEMDKAETAKLNEVIANEQQAEVQADESERETSGEGLIDERTREILNRISPVGTDHILQILESIRQNPETFDPSNPDIQRMVGVLDGMRALAATQEVDGEIPPNVQAAMQWVDHVRASFSPTPEAGNLNGEDNQGEENPDQAEQPQATQQTQPVQPTTQPATTQPQQPQVAQATTQPTPPQQNPPTTVPPATPVQPPAQQPAQPNQGGANGNGGNQAGNGETEPTIDDLAQPRDNYIEALHRRRRWWTIGWTLAEQEDLDARREAYEKAALSSATRRALDAVLEARGIRELPRLAEDATEQERIQFLATEREIQDQISVEAFRLVSEEYKIKTNAEVARENRGLLRRTLNYFKSRPRLVNVVSGVLIAGGLMTGNIPLAMTMIGSGVTALRYNQREANYYRNRGRERNEGNLRRREQLQSEPREVSNTNGFNNAPFEEANERNDQIRTRNADRDAANESVLNAEVAAILARNAQRVPGGARAGETLEDIDDLDDIYARLEASGLVDTSYEDEFDVNYPQNIEGGFGQNEVAERLAQQTAYFIRRGRETDLNIPWSLNPQDRIDGRPEYGDSVNNLLEQQQEHAILEFRRRYQAEITGGRDMTPDQLRDLADTIRMDILSRQLTQSNQLRESRDRATAADIRNEVRGQREQTLHHMTGSLLEGFLGSLLGVL